MPSSHLILCCPLLLLPPIPLSIRVFSNESTLRMRWPKFWSFSFSISPSNEHPGLISFRMDWLDLLAIQGTFKSLLQHHSLHTHTHTHTHTHIVIMGFPRNSVDIESACNAGDSGLIPWSGRSAEEGIGYPLQYSWASLVAQLVKNPPAMWETCVYIHIYIYIPVYMYIYIYIVIMLHSLKL